MKQEICLFYKTIDFNEFEEILKVIENIPNVEIENISVKNTNYKSGVKIETDEKIKTGSEATQYLKELNAAKSIEFHLCTKQSSKKFSLEYIDNAAFITGWYIKYSQNDSAIDAFIYNVKKIFKFSLWNIYSSVRFIIFIILTLFLSATVELKDLTLFYVGTIAETIVVIDLIIRRKKAYKKSYLIRRRKEDIGLDIIFYLLGVLTPYIMQWITSFFVK